MQWRPQVQDVPCCVEYLCLDLFGHSLPAIPLIGARLQFAEKQLLLSRTRRRGNTEGCLCLQEEYLVGMENVTESFFTSLCTAEMKS